MVAVEVVGGGGGLAGEEDIVGACCFVVWGGGDGWEFEATKIGGKKSFLVLKDEELSASLVVDSELLQNGRCVLEIRYGRRTVFDVQPFQRIM